MLAVNLLANLEARREILISLWHALLYAALWYTLADCVANRILTRENLIDLLLFGGLLAVIFGYIQLAGNPTSRNIRSLFINANALATFLIISILLLLGRIVQSKRLALRLVLGLYMLALLLLLYLTSSRGAMIGAAAGGVVFLLLMRLQRQPEMLDRLQARWTALRRRTRRLVVGLTATLVLVGSAGMLMFLSAFEDSIFNLQDRFNLWSNALTMLRERPLTGYGLASYGRHIGRFESIPPLVGVKNAHNFPVNVAGELGLLGLVALLTVLAIIAHTVYRNWCSISPERRVLFSAAVAAAVAYAIHHLLDMTSAVPMIALAGTVLLVVIATPVDSVPIPPVWPARRRGLLVLLLWGLVFASGFCDAAQYSRYIGILGQGVESQNYAQTAQNLQPLADADPVMMIYPMQQAYLWGLAAAEGDETAAEQAIAAYQRTIELYPYYAPYYANLGALYGQIGAQDEALRALQQAADLAPRAWSYHYMVGEAAEAMGLDDLAREHYTQALTASPDASLHPRWGETALQIAVHNEFNDRSDIEQVIRMINAGEIEAASAFWPSVERIRTYSYDIISAVIALRQDDRETAQMLVDRVMNEARSPQAPLWGLRGELYLARYDGDVSGAADLADTIQAQIDYDPMTQDALEVRTDLAFYQFYFQTMVRQMLPQVFYPKREAAFHHLLATIEMDIEREGG